MYLTLGHDCSPAAALRNLGLRTAALPFDWAVSSVPALEKCLTEDFARFHTALQFNHDRTRLIDAYGFEFPHDYPLENKIEPSERIGEGAIGEESGKAISDQWMDHYEIVMEKYRRRIDRFRQIVQSADSITILCRYSTSEVLLLREVLTRFVKTDRILIINSCSEPFYNDWIINVNTEQKGEWNDPSIWKEAIDCGDASTLRKPTPLSHE